MMRFRAVSIVAVGVLVIGLASVALGMKEQPRPYQPPAFTVGGIPVAEPFLMLQAGDTTWIQIHADTTRCPGDPLEGHGGEGTGGPDGSETYCVEAGVGDSCGTLIPWDDDCFTYEDVRQLPSQTGVNYWHVDTYRANQRPYLGSKVLWCGSAANWGLPPNDKPVECGTWLNPPGYGNQWHCIVQLALGTDFDVAAGCTVYFDPRYDLECKYDYYYIDYLSLGPAPTYVQTWKQLALFNGTSETDFTVCGDISKPNPDKWGFGDRRGAYTCNWVSRTTGYPAYKGVITHADLGTLVEAPKFRWRMTSDGAWSDADGSGDTDGATFLDNVQVYGDNIPGPGNACVYTQTFEGCTAFGALPDGWTLEDPPYLAQGWHIKHDPDRPFEGGDGGDRTTCTLDSSWVWRARPEKGYPTGKAWRNGWFYRLLTPKIGVQNTGAIVQYDQYMCAYDYTCDYTDTKVRYYDGTTDSWCPWINMDGYILYGGCFFMNINDWDDLTPFYGADAESLQMAWDLMDVSQPGETCRGKHADTDNQIDNVSFGFFDGNATIFSARGIDILHDSMLEEVDQAYNSFFDTYSPDTITKYSVPARPGLPYYQQMYLDVTDKDHLATVEIVGSVNSGGAWVARSMSQRIPYDPNDPTLGGEYYGTLKSADFFPGTTDWPIGTVCWYYIKAVDLNDTVAYFPARANPSHPDHANVAEDYFGFTILPDLASGVYPKILLVDGHGRNLYDWSPCMTVIDERVPLEDIYEATLNDAGYCYDKFDISGAGSNIHIHPTIFQGYDAVVWFTGPYFSNYLFDKEAQIAIRTYLNEHGRIVFCGDRIAYNMAVVGEDSLGGEFLGGILGATYQEEVESAFTKPYQYAEAVATVSVFGAPTPIPMDTMVVYRECPYLKDMSYVITKTPPWPGYTAQALLAVKNPGAAYPQSDAAIYSEYQGRGQAVFVNFDLCSSINHTRTLCTGVTPDPAPDFLPGKYYGRVELMKVILWNLFGLPGGLGSQVIEPPKAVFQWALGQSSPNPLATSAEIRFEVARSSNVSIKVFNAMGQLVKVIRNERLEPGRYVASWDGRNQAGDRVSSGVYFYSMEAEKYKATKKMLVVK